MVPEVGDLAWHKDGLDPREVTWVSESGEHVLLDFWGHEVGPFPVQNYEFTKAAD